MFNPRWNNPRMGMRGPRPPGMWQQHPMHMQQQHRQRMPQPLMRAGGGFNSQPQPLMEEVGHETIVLYSNDNV